ncbi:DUF2599 domain-containing protein [Nocardia seriolae]|uniref:DUF2599 domain-containing protein n=4 Tax=Nocardia seriolae TaxID=37332 RepID=A0ABC9YVK6_9NOCA|nr:DUF2599 domain-containing protein [Nocardia seriolae]APA98840.1 uncharacterized protein NS506_04794 [Nocardia seriolae]MTJ63573.1 DUF2599 domain-containing protein [Nocardia seriolae]MTJ72443.1 DUF2599 domain-containing protein [Nocardia seriolae]MTJ88469.1 DUF2599 domain-containing protein [Nocardia seriolae]MTK49038.1 DUF2599 domain-containing protein [Nocardia seriolae]
MRRRWKLAGGPPVLALALVLTGCGAAEESAPVVVSSLTLAPPAPAPTSAAAAGQPSGSAAPVPGPAPTAPVAGVPTVDPFPDQALIDHADWTDDIDGRRLRIYPTTAGRKDRFPAALDRAWQEVLTAAPDADTPGMYDQFRCHWEWARVVAPDKTSWNIEPWRPAVGYDATVAAMCNPGGPER